MSGLYRNTIDKFYTSPSVVELCIKVIKDEIKISPTDLILEPSAGNGAWMGLAELGDCVFYDLFPEHPEVIKQDFLELKHIDRPVHIVGNPPFGRQSNMAIKFIRKSVTFAKTISFILPRSFKKQSFQDKIDRSFHLVREIDLPVDSFLLEGRPHNVPCVFQIWEKRNIDREVEPKEDPIGYRFVSKEESPHISFRRIGFYAGKVSRDIDKSSQSHYFIQFDRESDSERVMNLEFVSKDYTVGPRSISKVELIKGFNKCLRARVVMVECLRGRVDDIVIEDE